MLPSVSIQSLNCSCDCATYILLITIICCHVTLPHPPHPSSNAAALPFRFMCIWHHDFPPLLSEDPPPPADTRHPLQADGPSVTGGRRRPSAGLSATAHSFHRFCTRKRHLASARCKVAAMQVCNTNSAVQYQEHSDGLQNHQMGIEVVAKECRVKIFFAMIYLFPVCDLCESILLLAVESRIWSRSGLSDFYCDIAAVRHQTRRDM